MPGKPSISSVHTRPGDGPLIITLAAMLLINMTVFCVIVGFDDLNRAKPTPAAGPSVPTTTQAEPDRAVPIAQVFDDVQPTSHPTANPAGAAVDSPLPMPVHTPAVSTQAEADDDAPLTFFGVPVH